jgi:hypothetical protein
MTNIEEPSDENECEISLDLVVKFLTKYYSVLSTKPQEWYSMIEQLEEKENLLFCLYNPITSPCIQGLFFLQCLAGSRER